MATPPSSSTPVLDMPTSPSSSTLVLDMPTSPSSSTPVLDMPTSPTSTKESPHPSLREGRRKRQQRRKQLRSGDAAGVFLEGTTGRLMPPPPVGTGAVIKIRDESMQPTLEDALEDLFIHPLQPEEEDLYTLTDALYGPSQPKDFRDLLGEEKPSSDLADAEEVWKTWVADHVLAWRDPYWPTPVYVRKDRSEGFHTYPSLGGPFRSLDEVGSAVVSRARDHGIDMSAKLSKLSLRERLVRKYLYWPDDTIRICTRVEIAKTEDEKLHRLVEALLDKHTDDEGYVGELKDIVHWQSICEGFGKRYYHLNIRLKTKGAADDAGSVNLFFAEVACDQNCHMLGYYIRDFIRVDKDDEVICRGCINNGSTDMKHPPARKFKGGHKDIYFPLGFGPCNEKQWRDSDNNEAQNQKMKEAKIQKMFDYVDDAAYMENLRNKRLHNPIDVTMEEVEDMLREY